MRIAVAALVPLAATAFAPAAAQMAPLDHEKVAATCGEMMYEQIPSLPKAEVAARLACYTREFAGQLNLRVPVKLDPLTTLRRVTAEGTTLSYHYSVDVLRAQVSFETIEGVKAGVRIRVCQSDDMRRTMSIGGSYRYYWNDRDGQPIAELLVDSCAETPAPSAPPPVT